MRPRASLAAGHPGYGEDVLLGTDVGVSCGAEAEGVGEGAPGVGVGLEDGPCREGEGEGVGDGVLPAPGREVVREDGEGRPGRVVR